MKKILIMILCAIAIIGVGSIIIVNKHNNTNRNTPRDNKEKPVFINVSSIDGDDLIYQDLLVKDYDKYKEILLHYETQETLVPDDFVQYDYLAIVVENDYCGGRIDSISDAKVSGNVIDITVDIEASCGACAPVYELYLVRFDKDTIVDDYKVNINYNRINKLNCDSEVVYKPIIYLYPDKDMVVNVKLGKPEYLTTTYPKYNNGWRVSAKSNGDLIDETGRTYYALYWEGLNTALGGMQDDGFVVKGEDTITFLEEKLAFLGLNEREANEFIMYWLPKLESNKYNYIRFATREEIDHNMPLFINPKPNNIIRIMMLYKPLNQYIQVKNQKLMTPPTRNGFTVVEWGGAELH